MDNTTFQFLSGSVISFLGASFAYFYRYKKGGYEDTRDKKKNEEGGVWLLIVSMLLAGGFAFLIAAVIFLYRK